MLHHTIKHTTHACLYTMPSTVSDSLEHIYQHLCMRLMTGCRTTTANFFGALSLNAFEHSVLNVGCFPSNCLLTPLMSPQENAID